MLNLKRIQKITKLPDKIIVNGKEATLAFVQMPDEMVSIGYYYKKKW